VGVHGLFRKPEKTYRLTVRRGDARRDVTITTRRPI
jgi:hypothetical protein